MGEKSSMAGCVEHYQNWTEMERLPLEKREDWPVESLRGRAEE